MKEVECDKEEYQCAVSLSTAFDPVNITPTTFLYDRNTAETWLEKNPRNSTIPHTRQPFSVGDITPNIALRAEMRQYFQDFMGTDYTGWEVIPDYPQLLSMLEIRNFLFQVHKFFPKEEAELGKMIEENWAKAWKRLNYLRLNLQMNPRNRQHFISDDYLIVCLGEIMYRSYSRNVKTEGSELFHREILRTIRVLDMSEDQVRYQLKPDDPSECVRFLGFLLRNLQVAEEGFHSIILSILSIVSSHLKSQDVLLVLEYFKMANPIVFSSTDLKNIAVIVQTFYSTNIMAGDIPLLVEMNTGLVRGLVQIFIYVLGLFKNQDRIGIVGHVCEALHVPLFLIDQLVNSDQLLLQQPALAFAIDMNLLYYIHEMIEIYVEQQNPHFINVDEYDWLLALGIARTLYLNVWPLDSERAEEYSNLISLHQSPICEHSDKVRGSVLGILQMFHS